MHVYCTQNVHHLNAKMGEHLISIVRAVCVLLFGLDQLVIVSVSACMWYSSNVLDQLLVYL